MIDDERDALVLAAMTTTTGICTAAPTGEPWPTFDIGAVPPFATVIAAWQPARERGPRCEPAPTVSRYALDRRVRHQG